MTTSPYQPQVVDGAPALPPAYGLLVAATVVQDTGWEAGAEWVPEQIGGGGAVVMGACGAPGSLGTGTNPHTMTAEPFVVWAEDHCSTIGFRGRDWDGRMRRQLEATQSFSVAHEFQLGTIRDAQGLKNVALKDATVIHPGAVSELIALSELEGALGETFKGRRGMIHVTPQTMTVLHSLYVLERAGQKWVTAQGTTVVADAGYTKEADGFQYAYASGPVQVHLSTVVLDPGSFADAQANGAIKWDTNDVKLYAEREALVQVDGVITATPGTGTADAIFKIQLSAAAWGTHS